MGDFGTAFLYVRPDRPRAAHTPARRVAPAARSYESHVLPYEPPGPPLGTYQLASGAAGMFEVGTPAWGGARRVAGSLDYIASIGVDAIMRYRQPLLQALQTKLPPLGFTMLTPHGSLSPIVAFACQDAQTAFRGCGRRKSGSRSTSTGSAFRRRCTARSKTSTGWSRRSRSQRSADAFCKRDHVPVGILDRELAHAVELRSRSASRSSPSASADRAARRRLRPR